MRLIIFLSILFLFSCFNPLLLQHEEPFFTMQRTACYGTCPQYTVSIYHNGKITYNGDLFVDKIGCFSSFISEQEVAAIKFLLDDIDFFSVLAVMIAASCKRFCKSGLVEPTISFITSDILGSCPTTTTLLILLSKFLIYLNISS